MLCRFVLPLTREWIEMYYVPSAFVGDIVLPLTREWIEMLSVIAVKGIRFCSPSYEGVD